MRVILITSSVLILALIALRYLLKRISPRLQYALWLLVAVRLLVPVSLPGTGLSILNFLPAETGKTEVYVFQQGTPDTTPALEINAVNGSAAQANHLPLESETSVLLERKSSDLGAVLRIAWLCGAATMAAWFLTVNLSFSARARKGAKRLEDVESPVPVYVSAAMPSPCLLGLARQRIYVTSACTADPVRLRHVLAHAS